MVSTAITPDTSRGKPARHWLLMAALAILALAPLLLAGPPARAATQEVFYPNKVLKARLHTRKAEDGGVVRHGGFQGFHPNGRPAIEGRYLNGSAVGVWSWWDAKGNLIRRARKDGDFEELLFGREFNSPNSVFRNTAKRKISEGRLKFNKGHGGWVYYFDDGTPKAEGGFLTGIPDGRWLLLYEDGQIRGIDNFKLGIAHGLFMRAYPNGQERVEGQMDQGLRVGKWRFWYPNGQKKAEGNFLNDQEEDEWRFWGEDGVLQKRLAYRAGKMIAVLTILKKREPRGTEVIPRPMQRVTARPRAFDEEGGEIHQRD